MGKLIILRGNSGSGKTTVAKELQKKFGYNTMLISQDEIRRNILWVKDGIDTKALPLMIELLKYGYEHSDIVILEGIRNGIIPCLRWRTNYMVQMYIRIILIFHLRRQ